MSHPGRVVLLTGASGGLGQSIALNLAERRFRLALAGRNRSRLAELKSEVESLGAEALVLPFDLQTGMAHDRAVQQCVQEFGALDVLINNAGIGRQTLATETRWQDWAETLEVNLIATMKLTQACLPHILKSESGAVVFVSSVSGRTTYAGGGAYCASKHGIQGYAGCLFEDVRATGTKVSTICPGYVATPMAAAMGVDISQVIQPAAIAEAITFVLDFPGSGCPTEIVIRCQTPPWV